jgi:hypothetical protein
LSPANCAIDLNTLRLLAELKTSESGSLASAGRSRPGGGSARERSISDSSSVFPFRVTAICGASGESRSASATSASLVQLRSELVFAEGFLVTLGGCECGPARALGGTRLARSRPDSLSSGLARRAGYSDGEVVVSGHLGALAGPEGGPKCARPRHSPTAVSVCRAIVISAPRGMENANVLSASPGFSLKLVKTKVDRLPCFSATVSDCSTYVPCAAVISSQSYSGCGCFGSSRSVQLPERLAAPKLTVKSRVRFPRPARKRTAWSSQERR